MPFYYLSPYVGDGSEQNRFKPRVADGDWVSIDFSSKAGGKVALVRTERKVTTSFGDLYLGDTLDAQLPLAVVRQLSNRLGVSLAYRGNLRGIVAELLIVQGREDGSRWRRLRTASNGKMEIWLQEKLFSMLPAQNKVITDNFNRADNTSSLGTSTEGWSWTNVAGTMGIFSNTASHKSSSTARARAESSLNTVDHYSQAFLDTITGDYWPTLHVRMPNSGTTQTWYQLALNPNTPTQRIEKVVSGSTTMLGEYTSTAPGAGKTYKVEADGSSIKSYEDNVLRVSVTDTEITAGNRCGIGAWALSSDRVRWDNFEAGDLVTAVPQRLIVGVGI